MTLTLSNGPLSPDPPGTVNYRVEGPDHALLFQEFPRRVRAVFAGQTVADTLRGMLLHETRYLPQLYIPEEDIRADVLEPSDHTTWCPFKGEATYRSIRVGERVAPNAVWAYAKPLDGALWLAGYASISWAAMDSWLDEDEEVEGHLRDPYHRVDVRDSSRRVRVLAGGEVLADTTEPKLLSETGLPNRWYLPAGDVRRDLLQRSETVTICPYKGRASYWSLWLGDRRVDDVAFSYEQPLEIALKAGGHLCFVHPEVTVEVDGEVVQ